MNTPASGSVLADEAVTKAKRRRVPEGASQVQAEDEAQFAALVERQWKFAYRVAWAVLRHAQDAEDSAQEAFLKIFRARAWNAIRDERAFVARFAWRSAVDRMRARRPDSDPLPDSLRDEAAGPEEQALSASWEVAMHRLIDSLPEDLRQPLALSVEMNSREIAAAMGIAEGTVRTRLMRARAMLREKMTALEERHYARG